MESNGFHAYGQNGEIKVFEKHFQLKIAATKGGFQPLDSINLKP